MKGTIKWKRSLSDDETTYTSACGRFVIEQHRFYYPRSLFYTLTVDGERTRDRYKSLIQYDTLVDAKYEAEQVLDPNFEA